MRKYKENDAFQAISDPTRRAILRLLSGREVSAGEIAAAFPQQRPAISKHLAILRAGAVVHERRDRQRRLYSIRPGAFDRVKGFLAELLPLEDRTGLRREQPGPEKTPIVRRAAAAPLAAPEKSAAADHPVKRLPAPPVADRFSLDFD